MSTAPIAHVDALWWLLTVQGYSKAFYAPGDKEGGVTHVAWSVTLWDSKSSTVLRFRAPTRSELLDQIVAHIVAQRLA